MKPALEALRILCPCQDFARFVLNAGGLHSTCCKDGGCECEARTEYVELPSDSESEYSVRVGECCEARHSG